MIIGAHAIVYSSDAEADRAFLRDVLGFPHVDAGGGWLIFGLPPAELAVHPAEGNGRHEIYLMVDDLADFVAAMKHKKVMCGTVHQAPWGALTEITLPGGGSLGVYQPRHARPQPGAPGLQTRGPRHNPRRTATGSTRAARRAGR